MRKKGANKYMNKPNCHGCGGRRMDVVREDQTLALAWMQVRFISKVGGTNRNAEGMTRT